MRRRLLLLGLITLCAAGGIYYLHREAAIESPLPIGIARETEIHVSTEVLARLDAILVKPGQAVRKGDVLVRLDSPELTASVEQSKAAEKQALADRNNVYAGVREEQIAITAHNVEIAKSNVVLARQQYDRSVTLAAQNFTSKQKLDEAESTLKKSEGSLAELEAQLSQSKAGPTIEERAVADAKVILASAATADVEAQLAKIQIAAPIDGTIGIRVAEPGEVVAPGETILTLNAPHERWFSFTIREDRLGEIAIGSPVTLLTPKGLRVPGRVTELLPLGEFAVWRAARAVNDHDLNSFLIRIDPTGPTDGIEPGMTVWIEKAAAAAK
ncbi:HlyD family secretion protein [Hyphomicrobium sp.]|jgi:HlyD family secretion protein|uniref:HlyD family secretion protein n=1 Tax=Hyphomicrobium sp. TaxID=82 RepID=UPI0035673150